MHGFMNFNQPIGKIHYRGAIIKWIMTMNFWILFFKLFFIYNYYFFNVFFHWLRFINLFSIFVINYNLLFLWELVFYCCFLLADFLKYKWTRRDFPTGPILLWTPYLNPRPPPSMLWMQGRRSYALCISNSLAKYRWATGPLCCSLEFFGRVYRIYQHNFSDLNFFIK